MSQEHESETVRITIATFLLLIVFSSFFWDNLKPVLVCSENNPQETLNYFGIAAIIVSFFLALYLFFIAVSLISFSDPPTRTMSKIGKFVAGISRNVGKMQYNIGVCLAVCYLFAWMFFLSPAKDFWWIILPVFFVVAYLAFREYSAGK